MKENLICDVCKEHPIAKEYGYEKHCKSCGDATFITEMVKTTIHLTNEK